ncbi:sensor histidine kinase [Paracraurococcus lichenis]|uniref:histidine kinase n=1 Tax=Paracraurococcus lichenis TaxID=3064888 RepID=A0ABT9E8B7_9PROT|nr:PAS domain-containing protein [Paracraurococcus sp. LOR1-02]MDO9712208.1 PAS domain-containing protein [Paracraurococcus sp. LOR1-02]
MAAAEDARTDAAEARAEADANALERDAALRELAEARAEAKRAYMQISVLQAKLAEAESRTRACEDDVSAQAEELRVVAEKLHAQTSALAKANEARERANRDLEARVAERTAEVAEVNAILRDAADALPHLVWSARPGGAWRYANRRWVEHTGIAADDARGFGWLEAVHPDDRDRVMAAWAAATTHGELRVEHRLRGRDGVYEWFETRALSLRGRRWGREADPERFFGTSTNIEEAKRAEAALRLSEARFRGFAETTDDVVWIVNGETGQIEYLSLAYERVCGEPRAAVVGLPCHRSELLHPEDRGRVAEALGALPAGARFDIVYRIVRPSDGAVRWIRDVGFPVPGEDGRILWFAGLARDITAAKEAETRQALLLGELNHRVKNALTAVQSIAAQTARGAEHPDAFQSRFQSRLIALAQAHDMLTQRAWRDAALGDLIRRTLAPHADGGDIAARVHAAGPSVWLRPEAAIAMHMALHELATNAAKYGALSTPGGRVEVTWHCVADEGDGATRLNLLWCERGGPRVEPPTRTGFGSRLLERGLVQQFGASTSLTFTPEGVEFRFSATIGTGLTEE